MIEIQTASPEQGAESLVVNTLKDYGITTLIVGEVGSSESTILDALGVKIYSTEAGKKTCYLNDLIKQILE